MNSGAPHHPPEFRHGLFASGYDLSVFDDQPFPVPLSSRPFVPSVQVRYDNENWLSCNPESQKV